MFYANIFDFLHKKQDALKHLVSVNIFIFPYYNFHIWKLIKPTGVDLNLQFPAEWEEAKRIKYAQGFNKPAPRDYVGEGPLTEPEALALYNFTLAHNPKLTISYHTQGEVIFWQYLDYKPTNALEIATKFSELSGYNIEEVPLNSAFAGYKDWFIAQYNKPGYTIEAGLRRKSVTPFPI